MSKDGTKLYYALLSLQTVTSIASSAFVSCSKLKEIRIDQVSGSISGSPWSCPYGARAIYWK